MYGRNDGTPGRRKGRERLSRSASGQVRGRLGRSATGQVRGRLGRSATGQVRGRLGRSATGQHLTSYEMTPW